MVATHYNLLVCLSPIRMSALGGGTTLSVLSIDGAQESRTVPGTWSEPSYYSLTFEMVSFNCQIHR